MSVLGLNGKAVFVLDINGLFGLTEAILFMSIKPPTQQEHEAIQAWLTGGIELLKFGGGFLVGYFAHWLVCRKDIRDRKRNFLAFMSQLIAEAGGRGAGTHGEWYRNKVPNISHAIALIESDIPKKRRKDFRKFADVATRFTPAQAENPQNEIGKRNLLEAFEDLKFFVKKKC